MWAIVTGSKEFFSNCHAHAVGKTLAKRSSCCFYSRCHMGFGMTGCFTSPLAEIFDVVKREVVTGEVH